MSCDFATCLSSRTRRNRMALPPDVHSSMKKLPPLSALLTRSTALRSAVLAAVMAVSACAGHIVSPAVEAERRASQAMMASCLKLGVSAESAKEICQLMWDTYGRDGARWASSYLYTDGSLRESREAFNGALQKQIQFEQRRCMNSWLSEQGKAGPPNLDPKVLGPMQTSCYLTSGLFAQGAAALIDEATQQSLSKKPVK
jgi:hypothetical protein